MQENVSREGLNGRDLIFFFVIDLMGLAGLGYFISVMTDFYGILMVIGIIAATVLVTLITAFLIIYLVYLYHKAQG